MVIKLETGLNKKKEELCKIRSSQSSKLHLHFLCRMYKRAIFQLRINKIYFHSYNINKQRDRTLPEQDVRLTH